MRLRCAGRSCQAIAQVEGGVGMRRGRGRRAMLCLCTTLVPDRVTARDCSSSDAGVQESAAEAPGRV